MKEIVLLLILLLFFIADIGAPLSERTPIHGKLGTAVNAVRPLAIKESARSNANVNPTANGLVKLMNAVFEKKGHYVLGLIGEDNQQQNCLAFLAKRQSDNVTIVIKIADFTKFSETFPYSRRMYARLSGMRDKAIINRGKNCFPIMAQLFEADVIKVEDMAECARLADVVFSMSDDQNVRYFYYQILEYVPGEGVILLLQRKFFRGKNVGMLIDSLICFIKNIQSDLHEAGFAHGDPSKYNTIMNPDTFYMRLIDLDDVDSCARDLLLRDNIRIQALSESMLKQAAQSTEYESLVKQFFNEWTYEKVYRQGLRSFWEALSSLRSSIIQSATRPTSSFIREPIEDNV